MADSLPLVGEFLGRPRIREGMEASLSVSERKRFGKSNEVVPLCLNVDGTFSYNKSTCGRFEVEGDLLRFIPETFGGQTLEQMSAASEAMGREFGLTWLFNVFCLRLEGDGFVTPDDRSPIVTEFTRRA